MTGEARARPAPGPERGGAALATDRSDGWLVVIDMQKAFADPFSAWAVEGYAEAEENIVRLLPRFPERVVSTRFVPDPEEAGSWKSYYDRWASMRQPPASGLWELTRPVQGAPVVSLPTFSKWGDDLVREIGRESPVLLCGVATDCCVLATALGAVDSGRPTTIVKDACAGVSRRHHDEALSLLGSLDPMVGLADTSEVLLRERGG